MEPEKSREKEIISFEIVVSGQKYSASIDSVQRVLSIEFPEGTMINELAPNIVISPKSTIFPQSNVPQDFSKSIYYKVTAEDGSSVDYLVNVTVLESIKSSEKSIAAVTLFIDNEDIEITIDSAVNTLNATVPYGTKISNLNPEFNISDKATLVPASGSSHDFSTPVKYTITAEDGTSIVYTFFVTVEKPTSLDLAELSNKWENQTGLNLNILEVENNGIIWGRKYVNSEMDNLLKLDGTKEALVHISKLPLRKINTIHEFDDSIWIGTSAGIVNINGPDTLIYNLSNLAIENNIKSFCVFNNQLYSLTSNSVFKFENSNWTRIVSNQSEDFIDFSISNNVIFFITKNSILEYDGKFRKFTTTEEYSSFDHIKIDSRNKIWISNWWGLIKFENEEFTFYTDAKIDGFPNAGLLNFIIDDQGMVWTVWGKHGVIVFDDESVVYNFTTGSSNLASPAGINIILRNNTIFAGLFYYQGQNFPNSAIARLKL